MQPNTQKKLSTSGGEDVCPGSFCLLGIQSGWRERLRIVTSVPSTTCGHKVKAGLSPYSYLPKGPSEVLTLFSKSSFWKECLFGVEGVWRWRHSRKCTDHKKESSRLTKLQNSEGEPQWFHGHSSTKGQRPHRLQLHQHHRRLVRKSEVLISFPIRFQNDIFQM